MKPNNMKLKKQLKMMIAIMIAIITNTATAQDKSARIDSIFKWSTPNTPGCVCAVAKDGKLVFEKAYGSADIEREVFLNTNSVFDIGSTHKQFVAASVLLLAEDGKLSLTDDIHKYIPQLPDYGHKISIDNLLTHTSGLRDWTGLLSLSSEKTDVLTLILRQRHLNFVPGEEWSYSNSGYVLAKEIVARVSGMSFGEFAHKRLFEPLGMKSTHYSVDMLEVTKNRALAYEKEGNNFKVSMRLDNNRGGGGILSTAGDLLTWNEALATGKLGKFVTEKLSEAAKLNNGRQLKYARGLFIDPYRGGIPMTAHSGGSAGYSTWLGYFPEQRLSIAVLCNVEPISATNFAYRIADLFLPTEGIRELEGDGPPPVVPEDIDISGRAGLYLNKVTGEPIQLTSERGRFRVAGGPGLVVIDKDRFRRWGASPHFMSQDSFKIKFVSTDEFELKSMEGKTTDYLRAKPQTYKSEELKAFNGKYESAEIGTTINVSPGKKGLTVTLDHSPDNSLDFESAGRDVFQWNGRMFIRFQRSKSGKIISLDYSNPVMRNVSFMKKEGTN